MLLNISDLNLIFLFNRQLTFPGIVPAWTVGKKKKEKKRHMRKMEKRRNTIYTVIKNDLK